MQFQYPSEFWMQYHLLKKNRCWQPIKLTRFLYSQRPAPRCDEALLLGSPIPYMTARRDLGDNVLVCIHVSDLSADPSIGS